MSTQPKAPYAKGLSVGLRSYLLRAFLLAGWLLFGLSTGFAKPDEDSIWLNVKDFGAVGDGEADDTDAIRLAISEARKTVKRNDSHVVIYFPAGTYAVAPQESDQSWETVQPHIFSITFGNVTLMGDGPKETIISCYTLGMKDPETNWTVIGDGNGYFRIKRGGAFFVQSTRWSGVLEDIRFVNLRITGNASATGNSAVGGSPSTGDGWDLSHKGIHFNGHGLNTIRDVEIINCHVDSWRGENIYAGGQATGSVLIRNTHVYYSNASAISMSAGVVIEDSVIHSCYNAFENFALEDYQFLEVRRCEVYSSREFGGKFGVAYLGTEDARLVVEESRFTGFGTGQVYLAEAAYNVVIRNNTFRDAPTAGIFFGRLGLYPAIPDMDFNDILIENNRFVAENAGMGNGIYFQVGGESQNNNFTVSNNRFEGVNGRKLNRAIYEVFAPKTSNRGNYLWINNFIDSLEAQLEHYAGRAIWQNNTYSEDSRPLSPHWWHKGTGPVAFAPIGNRFQFSNFSDPGLKAVIEPETLDQYPLGYRVALSTRVDAHTILPADPAWNNFAEDVVVSRSNGSSVIEVQENGKFGIVGTEEVNTPLKLVDTALDAARSGIPFSHSFQATGGRPPIKFTLRDQPEWLSIEPDTGQIEGTPPSDEAVSFTITVTDANEDTDSREFSVGFAPQIVSVESVLTVFEDDGLAIPVEVSGTGPVSLSLWRIEEAADQTVFLVESEESEIQTRPFEQSDTGTYLVRARNAYGLAESDPIQIEVVEAVSIERQSRDGSIAEGDPLRLEVALSTEEDATYRWFANELLLEGATEPVLQLEGLEAPTRFVAEVETAKGTILRSEPILVDLAAHEWQQVDTFLGTLLSGHWKSVRTGEWAAGWRIFQDNQASLGNRALTIKIVEDIVPETMEVTLLDIDNLSRSTLYLRLHVSEDAPPETIVHLSPENGPTGWLPAISVIIKPHPEGGFFIENPDGTTRLHSPHTGMWHDLWILMDNATDTFGIVMLSAREIAEGALRSHQGNPLAMVPYLNPTESPIFRLGLEASRGLVEFDPLEEEPVLPGYSGAVMIDDLYFHAGEWALEQPVARSLWEWVPLDESGFRETGIGWIYDEDYPWVLHASQGTWMYVHVDWSTLSSTWATVLPDNEPPYAIWTSEYFGGWFYRYESEGDPWQKW